MSINRNLSKFAPSINTSGKAIAATITVTVAGGKFVIDGTSQQSASLSKGLTYRFDNSDSSNATHPFVFSTATDGGGSSFTTGVTTVGTAGSSGAYVEVTLEQDAPDRIFYYCSNHSGMGGMVKLAPVGDANFATFADTFTFPTSDGAASSVLTSDGSGSLSFAAASGGGGSGGGSPASSVFATENRTKYTNASTLVLTGPSSGTDTYYICGGTQYRQVNSNSTGNTGGYQFSLRGVNLEGIRAGCINVYTGGYDDTGEAMHHSHVWDDTTNNFIGFPSGSTYDGKNGADDRMYWGAGGSNYTSGGVTYQQWGYKLGTAAAWSINHSIYVNAQINGIITVDAGETVDFLIVDPSSPVSYLSQARRWFSCKLVY